MTSHRRASCAGSPLHHRPLSLQGQSLKGASQAAVTHLTLSSMLTSACRCLTERVPSPGCIQSISGAPSAPCQRADGPQAHPKHSLSANFKQNPSRHQLMPSLALAPDLADMCSSWFELHLDRMVRSPGHTATQPTFHAWTCLRYALDTPWTNKAVHHATRFTINKPSHSSHLVMATFRHLGGFNSC